MANDKQQRADDLKDARKQKVRRYTEPSVGMGKYSDRIAIDPSSKVQKSAQRPGMRMTRT